MGVCIREVFLLEQGVLYRGIYIREGSVPERGRLRDVSEGNIHVVTGM